MEIPVAASILESKTGTVPLLAFDWYQAEPPEISAVDETAEMLHRAAPFAASKASSPSTRTRPSATARSPSRPEFLIQRSVP